MSLNYNLLETIKLSKLFFKYDIFNALVIISFIFFLVLVLNNNNKYLKYTYYIVNILLIIFIIIYYDNNIIKFNFSNPINNIYMYFFNSLIYLIIQLLTFNKIKYRKISYVFYFIFFIGISFSLFMTYYLSGSDIIVIGNIYPIIKFGNILYIFYFVLFILMSLLKGFSYEI